jgi:proteasome accessory factor C
MSADLTTLWMCGLPGYTPLELMDLEFESGYVSIRNAETLSKPRSITFQEGVALLLGLDLIASSLPEDREDLLISIASLRSRLTSILGVPVKLSATASTSGVVTTTISQAITTKSGLEISYHSMYRDLLTERTVMPIELYEKDNHQYLRAYCFTALDYREFRVDRVKSVKPTNVPDTFESNKQAPGKIDFSITTKDPSRDVVERFGITDTVTGSQLDLSSYSRQWIERSVMASGAAVVLNSPSEIRDEVAKKAQLMLNRYKEA